METKRRSLTLLLVLGLLLSSVAVVSAQGDGTVANVNRYLYMRALPDVKAFDYGRLDPGTSVTLVARTADSEWVKVELEDGTVGWGRANAVVAEGEIADLPVVAVTRESAAVTRFLTLRDAPVIDANSVVRLEQGAMVEMVAMADEYVYVVAEDGTAGWAIPRGLQVTRAAYDDQPSMPELPMVNAAVSGFANTRALPEMAAYSYERLNPGTPVNVVGRNADGDWFQIETLDGETVWATARAFTFLGAVEDVEVTTPAEGEGVVTRFAVLRSAPDSESAEVAMLNAGDTVKVLLASGDRVFVETADGVQGWAVNNAFSFLGGVMPEILASNATVSADSAVNLRVGPGLDQSLSGSAQVGERLAVVAVSADGEWYQVVPSSRVGAWVFGELVTLDASVENLPVVE